MDVCSDLKLERLNPVSWQVTSCDAHVMATPKRCSGIIPTSCGTSTVYGVPVMLACWSASITASAAHLWFKATRGQRPAALPSLCIFSPEIAARISSAFPCNAGVQPLRFVDCGFVKTSGLLGSYLTVSALSPVIQYYGNWSFDINGVTSPLNLTSSLVIPFSGTGIFLQGTAPFTRDMRDHFTPVITPLRIRP
jgi:hypothetical protein